MQSKPHISGSPGLTGSTPRETFPSFTAQLAPAANFKLRVLQSSRSWWAPAQNTSQLRKRPLTLRGCCTQVAGVALKIRRAGSTRVTKSRTLIPKLMKILTATLFSTFPISLTKPSLYLSPLSGFVFRHQAWGLDQTLNSSQAEHTWAMKWEVRVSRTSRHQFASETRLALH